ncbi:hypothetical protein EJ06DRAFT_520215 [Trichodelitschia bisporula]|uniref:Glutamyl-tRNA(Gln) amidotransferase subunit B, mitochondrial n=1 Tax=Trichodelitschia bisporula TaxID=703511 RepID=A0A6G1I1Y9_9PEZI|nr:hypothetical protein EJ06DRAFT_520215 [Trichodelitschia bisporula]
MPPILTSALARWRIASFVCASQRHASTPPPPLRKQLKDEAKRKRATPAQTANPHRIKPGWELTVGIEIHAELNTARKLFSTASAEPAAEPNTNVALFDLAYPGTQPHFQPATLVPAIRAALALGCQIQRKSGFDRKHYFYQDQPNGYQITQYYEPFAKDGSLTLYDYDGIAPEDGQAITIGIKQVQMEQDTAKTLQQGSTFLLDFNRVSHPLVEIITLPHIHHPATAAACVRKIQAILKSVNAVTAGMELGGLRADVNVSVRRTDTTGSDTHSYHGVTGLGQRTEIKNLSSFKAVEDAIVAERDRQIAVLEKGGVVEGETRGWTLGNSETRKLRGKEGEVDYRYMPDPDLPPVIIGDELVARLRETLPALPDELSDELTTKFGLTIKDAKTLLSLDDGDRLDYYFDVVDQLGGHADSGRVAGNWVLHELGGLFSKAEATWDSIRVPSATLARIVSGVLSSTLTGASGKKLLSLIFSGDARSVDTIIKEEGMAVQPIDDAVYTAAVERVLATNPDVVEAVVRRGQTGKVMWFVGQALRALAAGGVAHARPERVKEVVLQALDASRKE